MAEEEFRGEPTHPPTHHHAGDPPKMAPPPDKHHHHKESAAPPYHPPPRYGGGGRRDPRRTVCTFILVVLLLLGITALTLWLLYRPHHPRFRVVSAAVYQLNTSSPPFIAASMQFTVLIRNPNRRVTISYDPFSAYVAYKNQAITPPVILPPLYQDAKSTVALSPLIGGAPLPVEAELGNALAMDEAYGVVGLRLVLTGKLRYKGGAFRSHHYGIYVTCDSLVSLRNGFVGQLPLLGTPSCKVYV